VSLVAAGDLSRTVAVASRDELGTLAEGFNKMVAICGRWSGMSTGWPKDWRRRARN
jgi:hypothetical protein